MINLIGFTLGLACVIIIFRYVYGELTVERFNKNLDRIYATTYENNASPGNVRFSGLENRNRESTFVDLREHPSVEKHASFVYFDNEEIEIDDLKHNTTLLVADSNFLKIIDFPVISGINNLSDPKSALITKDFAQKLFGKQDPLGKTFRHSTGEILTITGVLGQTSSKSTLTFDMMISYYLTRAEMWAKTSQTLVLLYPNVDYRAFNKHYETFFDMPRSSFQAGYQVRYQLFPLSKVYFDKSIGHQIYRQGNYRYVSILMLAGFLILFVGIVNYINIFTVIVLRRGRELGIKKVFGAGGHNILIQLLAESLLMTGISLALAFFIVQTVAPYITGFLQLDQIPNRWFDISLSFILLLFLPVITTLFPFLRYHFSTPVQSLQNFDKIQSKGRLRTVFLSFQYVVTIAMVVVSLFFIKQLYFMLNLNPGYRTNDIVKVSFSKEKSDYLIRNMNDWEKQRENEKRIAGEIAQKMNASPLFSQWTYGESPHEFPKEGNHAFKLMENGDYQNINYALASRNWFLLFDIPLKEGRLWDDETDNVYDYQLIVTESVLKLYGIADFNNVLLQPEDRLWWSSDRPSEEMQTNPPYRIIGVVKDFDYLHLSQKSVPMAFTYTGKYSEERVGFDPLIAAIVPRRTQDAIDFLRNLHDETVGGEFTYSFVEDEVQDMYLEDKKIAGIYTIFTFISIFISVLGLLSMSLFDMQQRRKEIAIRKVNGATFNDVFRLLLKKYFLSLIISFAIASPIALLAINRYLEDFANKAAVSWWLFVVALVLTTAISLLTLIYQTVRAASHNPADVVKSE
jgi:ABC-type antimicrobial peptide transport system permease subunit